jgi:hypothetical protein
VGVSRLLSRSDYLAQYAPNNATTADNTRIEARLDAITEAILRYLGFDTNDAGDWSALSATKTFIMDGFDVDGGTVLPLPVAPVSAVASVRYGTDTEGTAGTDYTLATAGTDYRLRATPEDRPALYWLPGGQRPSDGDEVRVVATVGWATVPPALAHACGTLTARSLARDASPGVQSLTSGGQVTTSYEPTDWPPAVLKSLRPFTCPHARVVRS